MTTLNLRSTADVASDIQNDSSVTGTTVKDALETVAASVTAAVSDTAYDATSWNSVTGVAPSKNAVRDKFVVVDDAITAARKIILFGTGVDGSITYSTLNSRWEDGNGNALSNGSTYDGVATTTLVLKVEKQFLNVTVPSGCTLQLGESSTHGYVELIVSGTLDVDGTITSGIERDQAPGVTGFAPLGAVSRTTAGVGTVGTNTSPMLRHGQAGGSGAGGGDGTNAGGAGSHYTGSSTNHATNYTPLLVLATSSSANGTTTAGAAGSNGSSSFSSIASDWDSPWMKLPGATGPGGAAGALKTSNGNSGAGGDGGRGRKPVRITAHALDLGATAVIHADGQSGSAGGNGVAATASGDIAGGGGGGGGASGGPVAIRYGSKTDAGATIRSNGGTGGAGGLGYQFNATLRPTSDGGAGGNGSNGIVLQIQVL